MNSVYCSPLPYGSLFIATQLYAVRTYGILCSIRKRRDPTTSRPLAPTASNLTGYAPVLVSYPLPHFHLAFFGRLQPWACSRTIDTERLSASHSIYLWGWWLKLHPRPLLTGNRLGNEQPPARKHIDVDVDVDMCTAASVGGGDRFW